MLDRIRGVRHRCDLDLLLFFYRHPRVLLTAEQLVVYLGRNLEQVAKSLERRIDAGLVSRSQNPSRAARLYVLELEAIPGGLLLSFLKIAATREGRLEILKLLGGETRGAPVARLTRRPRLSKVAA